MTIASSRPSGLVRFATSVLFSAVSAPVLAEIDTFTLDHLSGPCSSTAFKTAHMNWSGRDRIRIASGERIAVRLYGHGADFAQDVLGSNIHEWITGRGSTTNYPGAPIMFGGKVSKGYVVVAVKAEPSDGLGNRRVTVKWLTGNERINLKIVADCSDLANAVHRTAVVGGYGGNPLIRGTSPTGTSNLLPALATPVVLTRPLGPELVTTGGGMSRVDSFFCSGLTSNKVATVTVPSLTWGVSGVNPEAANAQFDVQLIDPKSNSTLDTLTLALGFPPNTPLVQRDNYPGRSTSIRVILNPRFQVGTAQNTVVGCFTEPGSSQALDPLELLIRVDPGELIDEGAREHDNELSF